jgi:hypothetical protein
MGPPGSTPPSLGAALLFAARPPVVPVFVSDALGVFSTRPAPSSLP